MTWTTDHIEFLPVSEARKTLSAAIDKASELGIRTGLTKHGKPVAGIVPYSDVATLETIDVRAVEVADTAEAEEKPLRLVLKGNVDNYVAYITGQIDARLADAGVLDDPSVFKKVQDIISQTIHTSLDQDTLPNPPAGFGLIVEPTSEEITLELFEEPDVVPLKDPEAAQVPAPEDAAPAPVVAAAAVAGP